MHIGVILLGILFGSAAAVMSLIAGHSIWISLALYSAVGSGGAIIAILLVFILPATRKGQHPTHRQSPSELTFGGH